MCLDFCLKKISVILKNNSNCSVCGDAKELELSHLTWKCVLVKPFWKTSLQHLLKLVTHTFDQVVLLLCIYLKNQNSLCPPKNRHKDIHNILISNSPDW